MDGLTLGVFGTDQTAKVAFESSVGKKSEAEGITVYTRTEGGKKYSLLDTTDFPERIQGYSRIASLVDHALYIFPTSGKLSPPDGELAVLLGSLGLPGTLELVDGATTPEAAALALRGTTVAQYPPEERQATSPAVDFSRVLPRSGFLQKETMVYIDRAFSVKGVGTVALGFVLSGTVSIHDQLRPIPGPEGMRADVRGIQVNDVDVDSAGRGIRVGLSLRGVEPRDLERSRWLDDGSFAVSDSPAFEVEKVPFYRQEVVSRDLHIQLPGELVPAKISPTTSPKVEVKLPWQVPIWEGMKASIIDLNGGSLRVAAGATFKF